jgi:hypothetical protein
VASAFSKVLILRLIDAERVLALISRLKLKFQI